MKRIFIDDQAHTWLRVCAAGRHVMLSAERGLDVAIRQGATQQSGCCKSASTADLVERQSADLFAMARTPRPVCVSRESNSSLKGLPYTDSPPVPVPVGSPPYHIGTWLSRNISGGCQIEIASTHEHVPAMYMRESGDRVHRQHVCPACCHSSRQPGQQDRQFRSMLS